MVLVSWSLTVGSAIFDRSLEATARAKNPEW